MCLLLIHRNVPPLQWKNLSFFFIRCDRLMCTISKPSFPLRPKWHNGVHKTILHAWLNLYAHIWRWKFVFSLRSTELKHSGIHASVLRHEETEKRCLILFHSLFVVPEHIILILFLVSLKFLIATRFTFATWPTIIVLICEGWCGDFKLTGNWTVNGGRGYRNLWFQCRLKCTTCTKFFMKIFFNI